MKTEFDSGSGVSILSPAGKRLIGEFARGNPLIGFDFDGTLAPIATSPRAARLPGATRRLLRQVADRYSCLVISGRAYRDIAWRLRGVPLRFVFGNHGIEPLWADEAGAALVQRWAARLQSQLGACDGVVVENKRHSLAIHYRHARHRARARRQIASAVGSLTGARVIEGRAAVNLVPRHGADKGTALRRACRMAGCTRAIYIGDDGTDEDAFGALPTGRLLGIRVGRRPSRARYRLARQRDIDALLRLLLTLRRPGPARRPEARRL